MIRPSPELLAVSRRWYCTIARDTAELQNYLSKDAALSFVGSAEGETWFGPAVRKAVGAHFNEIPTILKQEELLAQAFEHGETGWAFFVHKFWFDTRTDPITFHTTLIFVLEEGSWKIAHRHAAVPSPNMETTGHEHAAIQALVEAAQKGFSLGQHEGLASVMFTDIVNSSTLAVALGDRGWSRVIGAHFANLRNIIENNGGQFVKSLGDGTMSSFASARQALIAARAIQTALSERTEEPRLSLRIGLHTGDVVQSDDDFFGTVVNKAARITALAGPGTILVSDVTRAMMGEDPEFMFADPISTPLKGFDGEHLIHHLEWRR